MEYKPRGDIYPSNFMRDFDIVGEYNEERENAINQVIDEAPEEYKKWFVLKYLKGMKPKKIVRIYGIPETKLKVISRGFEYYIRRTENYIRINPENKQSIHCLAFGQEQESEKRRHILSLPLKNKTLNALFSNQIQYTDELIELVSTCEEWEKNAKKIGPIAKEEIESVLLETDLVKDFSILRKNKFEHMRLKVMQGKRIGKWGQFYDEKEVQRLIQTRINDDYLEKCKQR